VGEIGKLEQARDPKCYATASRLEDFMYGTPLEPQARFVKNELQTRLVRQVWGAASEAAEAAGVARIDAAFLRPFVDKALVFKRTERGDYRVSAPDGRFATLTERDRRQYGTVAYGLRALLAVEQEYLLDGTRRTPLSEDAVELIKELVDVATLTALQGADSAARLSNQERIDDARFAAAWRSWLPSAVAPPAKEPSAAVATASAEPAVPYATLRAVVREKLDAYEKYNQISFPVFMRNVQVYFARYRWPSDSEEGTAFRDRFNANMVQFTADLLLDAERIAREAQHPLIRTADVYEALQRFEPHEVNAYEDVIYFPRLPRGQRVVIEAYDLDSFRDAGLHWLYLEQAIDRPGFPGRLEPDPFAAELLTEGVAQFGGLVLRLAGRAAAGETAPTLRAGDIDLAMRRVQELLDANTRASVSARPAESVVSSSAGRAATPGGGERFFTDVTAERGIHFEHRMADWLQRLLRSYVQTRDGVLKLAVPQAFGGAGIAAEDIDSDGDIDLLLLSGTGNALYLNDGTGNFRDVTAESGLDWRREDGRAGEPRQPIIADFDNDGWEDVFITYAYDDHRLYRNLGGHRFEDVTAQAGLGGRGLVGGPAVAFDFDNDGWLDLFIGYFGDYPNGINPTVARRNDNGEPDRLYRNLGSFHFADVTAGSGVANTGWGQAAAHLDFDRDGREDLIVGNDFGVNAYYRNLGGGRFEDVSAQLETDKPSYTMNVSFADLNKDGFPDVYISNIVTMNKDDKYVLPDAKTPLHLDPAKLATMRVVEANDLFMSHLENGRLKRYVLSPDAVGRGASSTGWSWGAPFFDFDLDGDEDLYCVNGMNEFALYSSTNPYFTDSEDRPRDVIIPVYEKESNVFFVNRDGKLWNESAASGADWLGNSRAAVPFDFDGDGDLDLALENFEAPAVLLRNNSEELGNHWLGFRLVGDPARGVSRDAIGARIEVHTAGLGVLGSEVSSSLAYLTSPPKERRFGIGREGEADVEVAWPNGERQRFAGVVADHRYRIEQGHGIVPIGGPGEAP